MLPVELGMQRYEDILILQIYFTFSLEMIYQFTLVMSSVVQTSLKRFLHCLRSVVIGLPLEHWRKKCQLV